MAGVTKIQTGNLTTPDGTPYTGIKITIGGCANPAEFKRSYEDIDAIVKSQPEKFKTYEERDSNGKFRSYCVST